MNTLKVLREQIIIELHVSGASLPPTAHVDAAGELAFPVFQQVRPLEI